MLCFILRYSTIHTHITETEPISCYLCFRNNASLFLQCCTSLFVTIKITEIIFSPLLFYLVGSRLPSKFNCSDSSFMNEHNSFTTMVMIVVALDHPFSFLYSWAVSHRVLTFVIEVMQRQLQNDFSWNFRYMTCKFISCANFVKSFNSPELPSLHL